MVIRGISYTYFMLVSRENLINLIHKVFPFNQLEPEKIISLVENSEVVFFKEGDLVYSEGATALNLYVIYEGSVEILVEEHKHLKRVNLLQGGDCFGEDTLRLNSNRTSTARIDKATLLVRIPRKLIDGLRSDNPDLAKGFSILSTTYEELFDMKQQDLPQDTIYYIGHPHYFSFFSKILLSLLILLLPTLTVFTLTINGLLSNPLVIGATVVGIVLLAIQILWHYFEWKNDYFVITKNRIINLAKSLINFDSKFEIPLSAVNNLEIKKSFISRHFDFGDLIIRTFTGETKLKNVPFVSEVQEFLELLTVKEKQLRKNDEKNAFERIVVDTLRQNNDNSDLSVDEPKQKNRLEDKKSNSPIIALRTHWIILIKRVLFSSLLIICIFLLAIFFAANHLPFQDSSLGIILFVFVLISAILWWLFQFFDWWNDQYLVTNEQVIDVYRKPFGTEDRRTAPINNIQSIRFERRGILGLLLNFGTLYIRVGDDELTFDDISNPSKVQGQLFGVLEKSIARIKESEMTQQNQNLAEMIDAYHQVKDKRAESSEN